MLGVSIPAIQDVTGGHLGVHVAASDVVLALIGARMLLDGVAVRHVPATASASARSPSRSLQYAWLIVVLLVIHLSLGSALKSVQRLELFALPVLVGAFLALRRKHMIVLRGYVLAATAARRRMAGAEPDHSPRRDSSRRTRSAASSPSAILLLLGGPRACGDCCGACRSCSSGSD